MNPHLLNPPTTTKILIEHRAPRAWPRVDLYALGMFLFWLGAVLFTSKQGRTATALSLLSIALFLWHYCRTWRQNAEAFNRYFRRNATHPGPPTDAGSIGPDPITPEQITIEHAAPQVAKPWPGPDSPPAMDAHERSLANYLSTPHLWN